MREFTAAAISVLPRFQRNGNFLKVQGELLMVWALGFGSLCWDKLQWAR